MQDPLTRRWVAPRAASDTAKRLTDTKDCLRRDMNPKERVLLPSVFLWRYLREVRSPWASVCKTEKLSIQHQGYRLQNGQENMQPTMEPNRGHDKCCGRVLFSARQKDNTATFMCRSDRYQMSATDRPFYSVKLDARQALPPTRGPRST